MTQHIDHFRHLFPSQRPKKRETDSNVIYDPFRHHPEEFHFQINEDSTSYNAELEESVISIHDSQIASMAEPTGTSKASKPRRATTVRQSRRRLNQSAGQINALI